MEEVIVEEEVREEHVEEEDIQFIHDTRKGSSYIFLLTFNLAFEIKF